MVSERMERREAEVNSEEEDDDDEEEEEEEEEEDEEEEDEELCDFSSFFSSLFESEDGSKISLFSANTPTIKSMSGFGSQSGEVLFTQSE